MRSSELLAGAAAQTDLYLFQFAAELWRRKLLIVGITFAFAISSALIVLVMPSWYRAEVLLAPADEKTSLGLSGQLGGLASLAGISVGGGDSESVAVLSSRGLIRDFIEKRNLLPVLFADEWNSETHAWKSPDPDDQPDLRDAVRLFDRKVRVVSEDRRTRLVKLSIEWTDPGLAAEWADSLADELNDHMRLQALAEAEANVEYLQGELSATTAVALQQSISRLLETEMQKLMLAKGNKDFAFRVVDRAEIPKRRSRPNRPLFVLAAAAVGGILSVLIVLFRGADSGLSRRHDAGLDGRA